MPLISRDTRIILICFLLGLAVNWQYGFSSTYLNTPVYEFKTYLNESLGNEMSEGTYNLMWNVIQNIWFVGFLIGIFLNSPINNKLGRKIGMLISNTAILIGSILQFLGVWLFIPVLLIIGRFISSIFTAVAFQAVILYLQEAPPTHIRGTASFLSEITFAMVTIEGMMLGTDQLLGNDLPWLVASIIPVCVFSVIVLFFVPESPKFLLATKNNREAAERSVRFYHGYDADVTAILKETEIEVAQETDSISSLEHMKDLVRVPHLRKALLLSVATLQNTVPLWTFIYNSTQFLVDLNIDAEIAKWTSTIMCVTYFICTIIGGIFIDRSGRRKILIPFSYINVASVASFAIFAQLQRVMDWCKWIGLASFIVFAGAYGCGVGAISWFISSELSPIKYRTLMQSACYCINTVSVIISTFAVLPLYNIIGSYTFLILYTLPSIVALYYLTRYLPETKGREIHEIVSELKR